MEGEMWVVEVYFVRVVGGGVWVGEWFVCWGS